jgi:hypothetical protein
VASNKGSSSGGDEKRGKQATPGSSAGKPSKSSGGKSSGASDVLYKAWMTGFAYEACRNLYLPDGVPPPHTDDEVREYRDKILPWLSTYLNLVSEWGAAGMDDVTDDLKQMIKDVRKTADSPASAPVSDDPGPLAVPTSPHQWKAGEADADDKFDSDFDLVLGAIRAKEPYGCYAALSGEYCSRLTHLREGDTVARLAAALRDNLCEMKNALPDGAYEVIDSDLSKIESPRGGVISELEKGAEDRIGGPLEKEWRESGGRIERALTGHGPAETSAAKQMLGEEIATWTDLMFGVATPEDILSSRGRSLAYTLVVAVGLGLILGIGLVILVVLKVVAQIPGMDLSTLSMVNGSSFISTVETVSTTLTTVGLSFGLLATKAWAALQAFERATILSFAKMPRFRRHVNPLYGQ